MYVFVMSGVSGKLEWQGNWISFMDTMLQFSILGQNTRELYLPTRLQRAIINTKKHKEIIEDLSWGEGELYLCYLFSVMLRIFRIKVTCAIKHVECSLISRSFGLNSQFYLFINLPHLHNGHTLSFMVMNFIYYVIIHDHYCKTGKTAKYGD